MEPGQWSILQMVDAYRGGRSSVLECHSSSRYLPAASALNCSASSISDNRAGPRAAAPKICSDICTDIPAEHRLALVHCHIQADGSK